MRQMMDDVQFQKQPDGMLLSMVVPASAANPKAPKEAC